MHYAVTGTTGRSSARVIAIEEPTGASCSRTAAVTGRNAMATAGIAGENLSDAEHSVQLRRAVVASTVGSVIESYDFLLYVLIAPLVFAKLYFPSSDPLVGTLQAFGIYAVGFISRPLGAAFFGHYRDRIGRKVTLIATLLITGLATFAVGFVPGYASIGIWGAIILTGIRFIQGIGVGGEWGGATWVAMGVGEDKCPSRLHHRVAAMGCSGRIVRREYRRPRIQRDFRRSISGLWLGGTMEAIAAGVCDGAFGDVRSAGNRAATAAIPTTWGSHPQHVRGPPLNTLQHPKPVAQYSPARVRRRAARCAAIARSGQAAARQPQLIDGPAWPGAVWHRFG